ncbi:hypothetical protein OAG62_01190 [bacterium]|nr:hypothetical protein [bacterium]
MATTQPYNCPRCGGDRTSAISVAYASGRTSVKSSGILIGGIPAEDGISPAVGLSVGEAEHVTSFAASIAPPEEKTPRPMWVIAACYVMGGVLMALGLGVLLTNIRDTDALSGGLFIGVLGGIALCGAGVFTAQRRNAIRWNKTEWPPLYKEWAFHWVCARCGSKFKPRRRDHESSSS